MDSISPATTNFGSVARTITKILRFRQNVLSDATPVFEFDQDDKIHKLKPSKSIESFSQVLPKSNQDDEIHKLKPSKSIDDFSQDEKEAMESLVASLFTCISAIKAAYAQLQVAQSPYDPDTIQSADRSVVAELQHLSELKHAYFKNQQIGHQNLIKTFQITAKKLESDIQYRDSEAMSLQAQLMESDRQNRSLESGLHPGNSSSSASTASQSPDQT